MLKKGEALEGEEKDDDTGAGDDTEFTHGDDTNSQGFIQPRWTTRVFAVVLLRKVISECCQGDRAHFDLGLAKEVGLVGTGKNDFLVLHLSELVRMCFMAATSDSDPLRLEGLLTMQVSYEIFTVGAGLLALYLLKYGSGRDKSTPS